MKTFVYKAKKGPEDITEGRIYANSTQEVVEKLLRKGFVATYVKEVTYEETKSVVPSGIKVFLGVSLKELIVFSKQLSSLLKAGVPILQSLNILSEQTSDLSFRKVIDDIAENIKHGNSLSSGLGNYPRIFSSFYRAMINAGENSGTLEVSLKRISDYYGKKYELISRVRAALAYPILIFIVGSLTLLFIFTNVIPKIIPMIVNLNIELPLPTKMLISISMFFKNNWYWVLLGVFLFALIFYRATKNKSVSYYLSKLKLNAPVFGDIIFKSEIAQFARAVSMALKSGISIIQAVNISLPILREHAIIEDIGKSLKELEAGGSLGETLRGSKTFPPFVYNLIIVGERSGDIEAALSNIAESYEGDCEEAVKTLTNLLEPVMVLLIGVVVGFIVMAVLLPILNLNIMGT